MSPQIGNDTNTFRITRTRSELLNDRPIAGTITVTASGNMRWSHTMTTDRRLTNTTWLTTGGSNGAITLTATATNGCEIVSIPQWRIKRHALTGEPRTDGTGMWIPHKRTRSTMISSPMASFPPLRRTRDPSRCWVSPPVLPEAGWGDSIPRSSALSLSRHFHSTHIHR